MISDAVVAAIARRLGRALAPPRLRYRPLRVDGGVAGWIDEPRAARLAAFAGVFVVRDDGLTFAPGLADAAARSAALDAVCRTLAGEGRLTAWRDEPYAAAPEPGAPPWFVLERAAARFFGIHTFAAHVNGLVRTPDGTAMWIARRSATKPIDPSLLDNLVGGGIAAGASAAATVVKEAWEEAGIDASLARQARRAGAVRVCRDQPDGLQRETIHVHDLWLPASFVPACQDGEAVEHRLLTLDEVASVLANDRGADVMTADASLVALDCLMRLGAIAPGGADYALGALREPPLEPASLAVG